MAGQAKTTKTPFEETGRKAAAAADKKKVDAKKKADAKKALKGGNKIATKQRLLSRMGPENATTCNVLRLTAVKTAQNGNEDGLRVKFTEGFRFNPKGLSRKSATVWINYESLKDVFISPNYCVAMDARGHQEVDFLQLSSAETMSLASVIKELDLKDSEVEVDLYLYFANIYSKMYDENPFDTLELTPYDMVHEMGGEVIYEAKFVINDVTGFEEGTTEVVAVEEHQTVEVVAAE